MTSLALWTFLHSEPSPSLPPPLPPPLLTELQALALQPFEARIAFLASLPRLVQSPEPAVRSAAYRIAAGAQGPLAWPFLVAGLDDPHPDVQASALSSLRLSSEYDWSRWLHALLHPTLRDEALRHPPSSFPKRYLLPLFFASSSRDGSPPPSEIDLSPLLDEDPKLLHSLLSLAEDYPSAILSLLIGLLSRWTAKDLALALHHLPLLGSPLPERKNFPLPSFLALAHSPDTRDPLDTVLSLLAPTPSFPAFLALALSALQRKDLSLRSHLRLALSLTRFHASIPWTETSLILAGSFCIAFFHSSSGIPLSLRRSALRQITDTFFHRLWPDPLGPLRSDPILFLPPSAGHPSPLLDLQSLASLLRFAENDPYTLLSTTFPLPALLASIQDQPEAAIGLLRLPASSKTSVEIRKSLLLPILDALSSISESLLASLIFDTPSDQLDFLDALEAQPERIPRLLDALSHEAFRRGLTSSHKKLLSLARRIPSFLPSKAWLPSLQTLVSHPDALQRDFSLECLFYMALHPPPGLSFAHLVAQLPLRSLKACLLLIRSTDIFPLEIQNDLRSALHNHPDPEIQTWLDLASQKTPDRTGYITRFRLSTTPQKLERHHARRIASCDEADLLDALQTLYEHPTSGLCKALEPRLSPSPSVEICAALLICLDPLEEVAPLLARFGSLQPAFLSELQACLLGRCQAMPALPLAAHLWMHTSFAADLEASIPRPPKASSPEPHAVGLWLLDLLKRSLRLPYPPLQWAGWKAASYLLSRWRWRSPSWLQTALPPDLGDLLAAVLTLGRIEGLQTLLPHVQIDLHLQEAAAKILVTLHQGGLASWMLPLQKKILPFLSSLPPSILALLQDWIAHQGVSSSSSLFQAHITEGIDAILRSIQRQKTAPPLLPFCLDPDPRIAEAGALRLLEIGQLEPLLLLLLRDDPPPSWRSLAETLPFWPPGSPLQRLRSHMLSPSTRPSHRLLLALGFLQTADPDAWPVIRQALAQPESESLWKPSDWDTLLRFLSDRSLAAIALLESPIPSVYLKALEEILAHPDPLPPPFLAALRSFLLLPSERMASSRLEVALRLHAAGDFLAYPLLLHEFLRLRLLPASAALSSPLPHKPNLQRFLASAPPDLLSSTVTSAFFAGSYHVPETALSELLLSSSPPLDRAFDAYSLWLLHSEHRSIQEALFRKLPTPSDRHSHLARLAEIGAWGVQIARALTGKLFQISFIGGENLGYTRLSLPAIFVNPLPLLRGQAHGADILKALIIHEIGHHLFHKGPDAEDTWKQAEKECLFPLLNLVSDEHLERRLRAQNPSLGDLLKRLASYAFQSSLREIPADLLFQTLAQRAFLCLQHSSLPIAKKPGHIAVPSGSLLREMEAKGLSFARFLRALRMGLGQRHQDPKVNQALALFPKSFRSLPFPPLLPIARKIREIFGSEIEILSCLHQDHLTHGSICDSFRESGGLTQDEINDAIQRQLHAQAHGSSLSTDASPRRFLNLDPDRSFSPLQHVTTLLRDPLAHSSLARSTSRWSRHLRETLIRLGLDFHYQRRLMSGPRLDPLRLRSALLLRDPRFLQARRPLHSSNLFLGILVDCSSSMQIDGNIEKAKSFAVMLAEAARGLPGVDLRLFGFNDSTLFDAGSADRCAASSLQADGGNNDAGALAYLAKLALQSRRSSRLLIMISDGAPTECSVDALRSLVDSLSRKQGILAAQVAVRPLDQICFPHYVELSSEGLETATRRFSEIIASLVFKALRS